MTELAAKIVQLGIEYGTEDLTTPMVEPFEAVFTAACRVLAQAFDEWSGPGVSDEDAADIGADLAATMAAFPKPEAGDVQGAPV